MEKYYHEFEDSEENKFSYTDIFKEYVSQSPSSFLVMWLMVFGYIPRQN